MSETYPYVTTVHRPDLPDIHLGFRYAHQAEHAAWSLTSALTYTAHVDGTTITFSATPDGVVPEGPVPTGFVDLAITFDNDNDNDVLPDGHAFPDTYTRLRAQLGNDQAAEIWRAACHYADADAAAAAETVAAETAAAAAAAAHPTAFEVAISTGTESVPTHELGVGDIVLHEGMVLRIDEPITTRNNEHGTTVYSTPAQITNIDELTDRATRDRTAGIANSLPAYILARADDGRWHIQCNTLADWTRTAPTTDPVAAATIASLHAQPQPTPSTKTTNTAPTTPLPETISPTTTLTI